MKLLSLFSQQDVSPEARNREGGTKRHGLARLALAGLCACLSVAAAFAQGGSSAEGIDRGNYHYQGSIDLGYRFVDSNGSQAVYDTFVNEQQGPRLLEQTLNIRSLNHVGTLFDNLFVSSFGWGGDPENAARLRMSKNKWYNFDASFRRDQNFWDYNLLANPFNPSTSNPAVLINQSPHRFDTVRRMYDYRLTLRPQSPVRVRLGYSRNNMEGPAFSSIHEGTDTQLFQRTRTLLDAYQAGVDIKLLPRTNISYDQFLQYYRGDSSWADNNFTGFQLAGGIPVDLGIAFNTAVNQPCNPVLTAGGTVNPACSGYLSYGRSAPTRVSYPTEQLTIQSNYFKRVDLSARGSYSSADSKSSLGESFAGLISRTRQRVFTGSGPSTSKRVVANADLGVTVHVTDRLRLVDSFRFSSYRIPGAWNLLTTSLFGATLLSNPNAFTPATCPPPFTAATCPQHSAASSADVILDQQLTFLKQDQKLNTFELEYDITHRIMAHIGYRYEHRTIINSSNDTSLQTFFPGPTAALAARGNCAGQPIQADGTCSVVVTDDGVDAIEISGNSLIFGISARPTDQWRLTFDTELFSADNALTRISPRNLQRYKGRVSYKPHNWLSLAGTVNVLESRNNVATILHREHNRNYGFTASLDPKPQYGLEFGYNYDDIFSTTNICYVITTTAPPANPVCGGAALIQSPSFYTEKINYAYTNIMFKPVKRVTANIGYNLTSTSGSTLILSPFQTTLGPLAFNFHRPTAFVDVDLARGFTWRTGWNYYDYNEKSAPGPLFPRDFQSNSATLALRYAF